VFAGVCVCVCVSSFRDRLSPPVPLQPLHTYRASAARTHAHTRTLTHTAPGLPPYAPHNRPSPPLPPPSPLSSPPQRTHQGAQRTRRGVVGSACGRPSRLVQTHCACTCCACTCCACTCCACCDATSAPPAPITAMPAAAPAPAAPAVGAAGVSPALRRIQYRRRPGCLSTILAACEPPLRSSATLAASPSAGRLAAASRPGDALRSSTIL
jgi:hypothetical protein